jgi:hypothetical protein
MLTRQYPHRSVVALVLYALKGAEAMDCITTVVTDAN